MGLQASREIKYQPISNSQSCDRIQLGKEEMGEGPYAEEGESPSTYRELIHPSIQTSS